MRSPTMAESVPLLLLLLAAEGGRAASDGAASLTSIGASAWTGGGASSGAIRFVKQGTQPQRWCGCAVCVC